MDYVKKRTAREVTPPDWWRELKKEEEQEEFNSAMRKLGITEPPEPVTKESGESELRAFLKSDEGQREYEQLARNVFDGDARAAMGELQRRFSRKRADDGGALRIGNLFKSI